MEVFPSFGSHVIPKTLFRSNFKKLALLKEFVGKMNYTLF